MLLHLIAWGVIDVLGDDALPPFSDNPIIGRPSYVDSTGTDGVIRGDVHEGATWLFDVACKNQGGDTLPIGDHTKRLVIARNGQTLVSLNSGANPGSFPDEGFAAGRLRILVRPSDQDDVVAGVALNVQIWTVAPDGAAYDQAAGTLHVRRSLI